MREIDFEWINEDSMEYRITALLHEHGVRRHDGFVAPRIAIVTDDEFEHESVQDRMMELARSQADAGYYVCQRFDVPIGVAADGHVYWATWMHGDERVTCVIGVRREAVELIRW